ncbi:MAG: TonB-dependent receptor [Rhodospirillaceae bacterium]|nr:TonB-dependent receptor [Rhodospirillaceae bacterium]
MTRVRFGRVLSAALLATTGLSVLATEAFAQIEEIVVTTRKRAENLQDVPIVVTAFTAANIERKGIAGLEDVAKYTSGLMLDEGFNKQDTRVVIRGLSPTRGRQNVAILQDDVDISSLAFGTAGGSFVINPRLLDIERIEVIKGPHSALYGRSAFNGAINYITKKPGDEFTANAQVDIGSHGKQEGRISASGPLADDRVAIGLNAAGWHFKGFYESPVTGKGLGGGEGYGIASTIVVTPNDSFRLNFRAEYASDDFGPEAGSMLNPTDAPLPASVLTVQNGLPPVVGAAVAANPRNATFPQTLGSLGNAKNFPRPAPSRNPRTGEDYPGSSRDIFRNTLRMEADFDAVTLTSITHYGDNETFQFNDALAVGDFANPAVSGGQETYFDTDIKLFSEELRVQSTGEGPLTWTFGGLYWKEQLDQINRGLRCASFSGGCFGVFAAVGNTLFNPLDFTERDTTHYSGYGLAEYSITDALKASVELRYTAEKEDTSGVAATSPTVLGCPAVTATGRATSPTGVISCVTPGPQVSGPLTTLPALRLGGPDPGDPNISVDTYFWTPRFTLDYKLNDDALVFASVALGKKPGGLGLFGLANILNNIYEPEEMWVYEVGAKTTLLDGKLLLNGAVYYQDFGKKQVSITFVDPNSIPTPNQLATRVVNAAKAEVKGFELEANAAVSDQVSLTASYTYNDGKYKDFTDINSGVAAISRAVFNNPNACVVTVVNGANRCVLDYSGNRLEGAPKHSLIVGGEVRGDLSGDLGWFVDADMRYQTSRFTSFENSLVMDSYFLADFRAGVKSETWSVTAYLNNAFNDDTMRASAVYIQNWNIAYLTATGRTPIATQAPSGARAVLPDKRQVGVRASVNF